MAGSLTRGVTILALEPLSTLGPKLAQLVDLGTFSGFSDDESGSMTVIARVQSSAPSSVVSDFWSDTASRTLRYYGGASGQERWSPFAIGGSVKNSTGATRAANDVVGFSGTPADLSYNADATNRIAGVVGESTADGSFGLLRMSNLATVKVSGAVARGDFLTKSGGAGNEAISGTITLNGAFGVALTAAAGPGSGTVTAYLFPWNSTT